MAKLNEEVLAHGRAQVVAQDMDGFKAWCEKYAYTVKWAEIEKTFKLVIAVDPPRAVKLFDRFFGEMDIAADVRMGLARIGCFVFFGLGALGGVVYLVTLML